MSEDSKQQEENINSENTQVEEEKVHASSSHSSASKTSAQEAMEGIKKIQNISDTAAKTVWQLGLPAVFGPQAIGIGIASDVARNTFFNKSDSDGGYTIYDKVSVELALELIKDAMKNCDEKKDIYSEAIGKMNNSVYLLVGGRKGIKENTELYDNIKEYLRKLGRAISEAAGLLDKYGFEGEQPERTDRLPKDTLGGTVPRGTDDLTSYMARVQAAVNTKRVEEQQETQLRNKYNEVIKYLTSGNKLIPGTKTKFNTNTAITYITNRLEELRKKLGREPTFDEKMKLYNSILISTGFKKLKTKKKKTKTGGSGTTTTTTKVVKNKIETTTEAKTEATTEAKTEAATERPTETVTQPATETQTSAPVQNNNNNNNSNSNSNNNYYEENNSYADYSGESENTVTTEAPVTEVVTTPEDVIVEGNTYKLPTSSKPVTETTTTESKGGNSVIPVLAGLSAAAAAGIGAKAYIDRKNNRDDSEDDEEFKAEDWSGNTEVNMEYQEPEGEKVESLDFDEPGYEEEEQERYGARTNQDLEKLQ